MRGPIIKVFSGPLPALLGGNSGELLMEILLSPGTSPTVDLDGHLTFTAAPVGADNGSLGFTRPKGAQWKRERRGRGGR
jgi:hypothetical protein